MAWNGRKISECWQGKHVDWFEVLKTGGLIWGVENRWTDLRCWKQVDWFEVLKTSGLIWGVENKWTDLRHWKQGDWFEALKTNGLSWGVENKWTDLRCWKQVDWFEVLEASGLIWGIITECAWKYWRSPQIQYLRIVCVPGEIPAGRLPSVLSAWADALRCSHS
jgi:flavin-binding protein dodecin